MNKFEDVRMVVKPKFDICVGSSITNRGREDGPTINKTPGVSLLLARGTVRNTEKPSSMHFELSRV